MGGQTGIPGRKLSRQLFRRADDSQRFRRQKAASRHGDDRKAAALPQAETEARAVVSVSRTGVRSHAEGEFHLVAEMRFLRIGKDGEQRRGRQPADTLQGVPQKLLLPAELGGSGKTLPGAAAALCLMRAERSAVVGASLHELHPAGFGKVGLAPQQTGPDRLSGKAVGHEDDAVRRAGDAAPVVGERLDDNERGICGHAPLYGFRGGAASGGAEKMREGRGFRLPCRANRAKSQRRQNGKAALTFSE